MPRYQWLMPGIVATVLRIWDVQILGERSLNSGNIVELEKSLPRVYIRYELIDRDMFQ